MDVAQPERGEVGPVLFGGVVGVHAEAVSSGGVVVELGGDFGVEESPVVDEGVFAVAGVIFGLDEEGSRRELVGGVDGVEGGLVGLLCEVGWVGEDREVGTGVDARIGVGRGGCGCDVVVVGVRAEEDGEVGACGETHDADVGWVDVPLGGVGASEPHGLLSVFKVRGIGGIVAGFADGLGDAVFDENAGDAERGEPVAGVVAFAVHGEDLVAAAREDQGRGTGAVAMRREDGECGNGDVGETLGAVAADEVVGGFGEVGFGRGGLCGLGESVRPEGHAGLRRLSTRGSGKGCDAKEEGDHGSAQVHVQHSKPRDAR